MKVKHMIFESTYKLGLIGQNNHVNRQLENAKRYGVHTSRFSMASAAGPGTGKSRYPHLERFGFWEYRLAVYHDKYFPAASLVS